MRACCARVVAPSGTTCALTARRGPPWRPHRYLNRLATTALAPFLCLVAVVVIFVVLWLFLHSFKQRRSSYTSSSSDRTTDQHSSSGLLDLSQYQYSSYAAAALGGALNALPLVLFLSFLLCASTSSSIFRAWDCVSYDVDSAAGRDKAFLRSDLALQCWQASSSGTESTAEYQRVRAVALAFVVLWPIGFPLLYLALLLPQRRLLRERRTSRLSRATAFLHREYAPR